MLPFERPVQVDIEEEMKRSYLDYAMSVIIGRALPDVRDGLKPVHRRVLYGMWEAGNTSGKPYKKSARIVGDVMGKYHPHGDTAIYDTVVRMAQDFSLRYLLVDGQGNFGSIDGDNPAAMRYTEVRLTKLAEEMLKDDIDKETVDWGPNYDGREVEPLVLPAKVPNLLINGGSGIAVGMATNIPPHNLGEVCDGLDAADRRPRRLDSTKLMQAMPGPDFPTAGFIHGLDGDPPGLRRPAAASSRCAPAPASRPSAAASAGDHRHRDPLPGEQGAADREDRRAGAREADRGDLRPARRVRPRRHPHRHRGQARRGARGHPQPALQADPDAVDLRHHHARDRRQPAEGAEPRARCCATSSTTGRPSIIRRTRYDLRKAEERAHILEGLLKALDHLDEVITTIRQSQTPPEARERLMAELRLHPGPGRGDPRHAPAAADRPRAPEDRRRVPGAACS